MSKRKPVIGLGCRFSLSREQLAQIVSHGLLFCPPASRKQRERSWTMAGIGVSRTAYSGELAGHGISRTGLLKWARSFVLRSGLWQVCWGEEAAREAVVKTRAYELVDTYFPELKG